MTQQSDEHISALIDGELNGRAPDDAVNILLKDDDAGKCWARYHLISDVMKQNLPKGINFQLSSRVMAALENEPAILAPKRRLSNFKRQLTGLAVAASVTAVAVFGVQNMYQQDGGLSDAQISQVATQLPAQFPSQATLMNKYLQPGRSANIQIVNQSEQMATRSMGNQQGFRSELNKYFIDHSQQSTRVIQGVVPYARIITYPNQYHSIMPSQK